MFRIYRKEIELDIRNKMNGMVYYIRKNPLVRRLLPGTQYRFFGIKNFFIALGPLSRLLDMLLGSGFSAVLLYFTVFGYAILFHLSRAEILTVVLSLYTVAALTRYTAGKDSGVIRRFYELFHVSPTVLIKNKLFFDAPLRMVARGLVFWLLGRFIGIDAPTALSLAAVLYGMELFGNACWTILFAKNIFRWRSIVRGIVVPLLMLLLLMIPAIVFQWDLVGLLPFPLLPIAGLAGIVSGVFLWRYPHHTRDFTTTVLPGLAEFDVLNTESMARKSSKLKEEDLNPKDTASSRLKGYALLNALFFRRHRRLLLKPFLIKTGLITGILALGTLYLYFPFKGLPVLPVEELTRRAPGILPYLAYLLFNQEHMAQKMFINCDQSFLQYGFYRRPADLLGMFSLRLRTLLLWNLLPLGIMLLLFLLALPKIGFDWADILVLCIEMLGLTVFFSVHTLFIYYLFQPYNAELQMKSPVYSIIQAIVYILCFATMQAGIAGFAVAPFFIGAALIYSVVALWAVRKYAPVRFRVRT
jgi:hypothetical protein